MAISGKILVVGFLITLLIFSFILFSNSLIGDKRESIVLSKMNNVVKEYEDLQTIFFMSDFLGENATCPSLQAALLGMNNGIWDLGRKIDDYREATEQFQQDPFYIDQKREFNRKEVLYFLMLKKMKKTCGVNQTIVSFFYKKKDECADCDAQSFVLVDIKKDFESMKKGDEIAIFSFDSDTNLTTVNLLTRYYGITSYPCTLIEDKPYCGLRNKDEIVASICNESRLSICK